MDGLDVAAKKEFSYGGGAEESEPEETKTGEENG